MFVFAVQPPRDRRAVQRRVFAETFRICVSVGDGRRCPVFGSITAVPLRVAQQAHGPAPLLQFGSKLRQGQDRPWNVLTHRLILRLLRVAAGTLMVPRGTNWTITAPVAAAEQQLRALGERAEPALREAVKTSGALETTRRIDAILAALDSSGPLVGESLCGVRAVQVLERIGSSESRRLLEELAQGVSAARLTRAASESLQRLRKQ